MPSPPSKQRKRGEKGDEGPRRTTRATKEPNHVEAANKKSDEEFIREYMNPSEGWRTWSHPEAKSRYTVSLQGTRHMSESDLDACFDLIEETSGDDYRHSSFGWHPAVKKKEMRSPDLRYILVKADGKAGKEERGDVDGDGKDSIYGFMSMMPTFENGEPVVYLYEIHLRPELQGSGLGKQLMGYLQSVASNIPGVGKAMLTCFVTNERGMAFYRRLGFSTDDFSPRDRKLRGGKVVTSDYVILSWRKGVED